MDRPGSRRIPDRGTLSNPDREKTGSDTNGLRDDDRQRW